MIRKEMIDLNELKLGGTNVLARIHLKLMRASYTIAFRLRPYQTTGAGCVELSSTVKAKFAMSSNQTKILYISILKKMREKKLLNPQLK